MARDEIEKFRSRFGFQTDPEEPVKFRNRILHAWEAFWQRNIGRELIGRLEDRFSKRQGTRYRPESYTDYGWNIQTELKGADDFEIIVTTLQNILWTFADLGLRAGRPNQHFTGDATGEFFKNVAEAIDLSSGIDLRIQDSDGIQSLIRAGDALLDKEVVDVPTSALTMYEDVQKEFRAVQEVLAAKRQDQYRHAFDALRFALEKLLKILLENNSGIEEQGAPLKEWMKKHGVHEDLTTFYGTLLNRFASFQNECIKHDNEPAGGELKNWREYELEFVLYMTGVMLRFLLEVQRS